MRYLPGVLLLLVLGVWLLVKALLLLLVMIFWASVAAVGFVFLWILGKLLG